MPDAVEFIDEVPKTSVGKFSKKDLRSKFAEYELPSYTDRHEGGSPVSLTMGLPAASH